MIILLLFALGGILALIGPLHPGSIAFRLQYFVEEETASFYTNPEHKASYTLELLDRRIKDLKMRVGTKHEVPALNYMDKGICSYHCLVGIDIRRNAWPGEPIIDSHGLTCGECLARCQRGVLRFAKSNLFVDLTQSTQRDLRTIGAQGVGNA